MYPPTWLFAAMNAKSAYSLSLMLAFAVAGLGTYGYLRRLGMMRSAATFGAMAMMFCGFYVGHRVHLAMLQTAAWLPWGLWCIEMLRSRPIAASNVEPGGGLPARRPMGVLARMAPVAYLALTAGHWAILVYMVIIWTVYLLLRARPLGRALAVAAAAMLIAAVLAAPQIDATHKLMGEVTRSKLGYAIAAENSYNPLAAVLMLFPMLYGCRTPNFMASGWWGPWHLCEMLGYVGLVTLVLAMAGVWRLYRKKKIADCGLRIADCRDRDMTEGRDTSSCVESDADAAQGPPIETIRNPQSAIRNADSVAHWRSIVRVWTWIGIGAMLWMLGYYLPTYRLVHALPVLGVVRCPSRMVLALDMALVTLAAVTVQVVSTRVAGGDGGGMAELAGRRGGLGAARVTVKLPLAMGVALGLIGVLGGLCAWLLGGGTIPTLAGNGHRAMRSLLPTNPAVWVQVALMLATILVVRWWVTSPRRRAGVLVALVLADLFFVTRFVDVPASNAVAPDPDDSPAARWLAKNGPQDRLSYRVWGIGASYNDRAAEILRPKTANALGISTINSYGPFQSAAHTELFEFQIYGTNRCWERLIRRNDLLSAYGVQYILTTRADVRKVLDDPELRGRMAYDSNTLRPADGPNMLADTWDLQRATLAEDVMRLRAPFMWSWSMASQPVRVRPGAIYRIRLDARAPQGGAANYLRAEVHGPEADDPWPVNDMRGLMAFADQIGTGWRHYEWTFRMPADTGDDMKFRVYTQSETPIEVRNVELRESHWDRPRTIWPYNDDGQPGPRLYRLRAELPARRPGDPPVAIYENMGVWCFYPTRNIMRYAPMGSAEIEKIKWARRLPEDVICGTSAWPIVQGFNPMPAVGVQVKSRPTFMLIGTAAGLGLYAIVLAVCGFASRQRRRDGRIRR